MEKIKIKRKITSSTLTIKELDKFLGKEVDIVIKEGKTENFDTRSKKIKSNVAGILEKYNNNNMIERETSAWTQAVKDKHGDR